MAIRKDHVESAVKFLHDPQVASAPLAKRVEFLESKELTQEEIEEALKQAASTVPSTSSPQSAAHPIPSNISYATYTPTSPPPLPSRDWRDIFVMSTVSAGAAYGLYILAKRYVLPAILPPTPAALEADKAAIESEFTNTRSLLEELKSETESLKAAEAERNARIDTLVSSIEEVVANIRLQADKHDTEYNKIKAEVEEIRDSLPSALNSNKEAQKLALDEVQSELKSLRQLLSTRSGKHALASTSIPATTTEIKSTESRSIPVSAVPSSSNSSSQPISPPNGVSDTPKASIPAWQRAALDKSPEPQAST
ncbi:hypothetical protein CANCADRAFT_2621 [Tortispora caseinolytica NRRL Y-17796]|uniref:Peroxisomal membrane protein PEX14 n=1 Tax=Tortispora caseinolytica NRRL Y-17796 TaxID=767744 RepID=A0A1E4TGK3_9ASCO|nr:hypothetical protein CANCADRAFT_2621 [Tortispora caseinolytica NRRL Y-17796]